MTRPTTNPAQRLIGHLQGVDPEFVTLGDERGRNPHHTKKGPGRKHAQGKRAKKGTA